MGHPRRLPVPAGGLPSGSRRACPAAHAASCCYRAPLTARGFARVLVETTGEPPGATGPPSPRSDHRRPARRLADFAARRAAGLEAAARALAAEVRPSGPRGCLSAGKWSPAPGPPDRRIGSSGCNANTSATCSPRHQSADVLPAMSRLAAGTPAFRWNAGGRPGAGAGGCTRPGPGVIGGTESPSRPEVGCTPGGRFGPSRARGVIGGTESPYVRGPGGLVGKP